MFFLLPLFHETQKGRSRRKGRRRKEDDDDQ